MKLMPFSDLKALLDDSKNVDFNLNPDLTYNSAADLIKVISVDKILDNITISNDDFKNDLLNILKCIINMHVFTVDFKRFICLEQKKYDYKKETTVFSLHIEDNKVSYFYKNKINLDYTEVSSTIELKDDLLVFFKKTVAHNEYRYPSKMCNKVSNIEECYIYSDNFEIFRFNDTDIENYYIDNQTKQKLLCTEKPTYKETIYLCRETEDKVLSKHEKTVFKQEGLLVIPTTEYLYFQTSESNDFKTSKIDLNEYFTDTQKNESELNNKQKKMTIQ